MSKNVRIASTTYNNVPSIEVPLANGGGNAVFVDSSDANATTSDIVLNKTAYVNSSKVTGNLVIITYYTGNSTPSSSLGSNGDIYLKIG